MFMADEEEVFMIASENCPHCAEAEKILEEDIKNGKIKVVHIEKLKEEDPLAKVVVGLSITAVPTFVAKVKDSDKIKYCKITKDGVQSQECYEEKPTEQK